MKYLKIPIHTVENKNVYDAIIGDGLYEQDDRKYYKYFSDSGRFNELLAVDAYSQFLVVEEEEEEGEEKVSSLSQQEILKAEKFGYTFGYTHAKSEFKDDLLETLSNIARMADAFNTRNG